MEKINILLLWPKHEDSMLGIPLGFGYLLSNCSNEKFRFKVIDCILEDLAHDDEMLYRKIDEFAPTIIGISSSSSNFNETLAIVQTIKKNNKNVCIILGGPHATAYGKQVFDHKEINFLFRGEAEQGFLEFMEMYTSSEPNNYASITGLAYRDDSGNKHFNNIAKIENLDSLKIPDYDGIQHERYISKGYNYLADKQRCAPLYCTRGCPYTCNFCSVPTISGKVIRKHSIGYLIDWVTYLYQQKNIRGFNIIDDNFTFDISFAKEFCRQIIKLGYDDIEINSPNGIRMQRGDPELWTLMRQAGWVVVTVAPESGSQKVLELMQKKINPEIVPGIVRDMKDSGLRVKGFFILGFPGETLDDLQLTERLIQKCAFDHLSVTFFQPMPGTPIHDELCKKGEINPDLLPAYFKNGENPVYITNTLKDFDLISYRQKLLSMVKYQ